VFALRDEKIEPKHGRWMANYVMTFLRIVLRFAYDRGWVEGNPLLERLRKIKAREGSAANRPWSEDERRVVLERAPPHLLLPIALALFSRLRKSDFLTVTMAAVRGDPISLRTAKRGVCVKIPLHPTLKRVIENRPKSDALQIALNFRGQAWTESGFNSSFRSFRLELEREGLVAPGLTRHGLRHTLATRLREAGADDRTIADGLGQRSLSMARHYSESAALPEHARSMVAELDPTTVRNKR
jgi:integrase